MRPPAKPLEKTRLTDAGQARQPVEKVHSQKIIHKKFSPAFFKRRWGQGAKPLSSSAEDEIFPFKERRRGVKRPTGTFYGGDPSPGVPRCDA